MAQAIPLPNRGPAQPRVYAYKPGRAVPFLPPQTVGEELERIEAKYGILKTEYVLKESRSARAVLHDQLDWNDKTAGHAYRLDQVRKIINSVTVVIEDRHTAVQAFPNVTVMVAPRAPRERCYQRVETVLETPELRQQIVQRVIRQLKTIREQNGHLAELEAMWHQIDALL